jgi:hypothetical protein
MAQTQDTSTVSIAEAEKLQRQTCKWLFITTAALCALVTVMNQVIPADLYHEVLAFEPWHAGVTAALLLWGWRGDALGRVLATLALALGMLYVAPIVFGLGMLIYVPTGVETDGGNLPQALIYLGVLLVYYEVALALIYRAHQVAKKAILKRD